jgi:hypothetical protein
MSSRVQRLKEMQAEDLEAQEKRSQTYRTSSSVAEDIVSVIKANCACKPGDRVAFGLNERGTAYAIVNGTTHYIMSFAHNYVNEEQVYEKVERLLKEK